MMNLAKLALPHMHAVDEGDQKLHVLQLPGIYCSRCPLSKTVAGSRLTCSQLGAHALEELP